MFKLRIYLILLAALVIGGVLIGLFDPRGYSILSPGYADGIELLPEAQRARERKWLDDGFARVHTLGADESQPGFLYAPIALEVDGRGHVFIADGGDWTVKEYSPEGRFVRAYGNGRGQGPGEMTSVTDLEFGDGGELWVADSTARRIHLFGHDGEFLRSVPTEAIPYRLARFGAGRVVALTNVGSDHLFGVLDREGRLVESFGGFLEEHQQHGLVLDGHLARDGRGGFVYAGLYAGLMAAYSDEGELRYFVSTVEGLPLPRLFRDSEGARWVDREAPISALNLSVAGDEIHVVSSFDAGIRRLGVLDTYALADGSYRHSRRTPEGCADAAVHGEYLYTLNQLNATKWKIGS